MKKITTIVTLKSLEATSVRNEEGEKIEVKKGAEFTTTQKQADYYMKSYASKFVFVSSDTVESEKRNESNIVWVGDKPFTKTNKEGIARAEKKLQRQEEEEEARNKPAEAKVEKTAEEKENEKVIAKAIKLGIEVPAENINIEDIKAKIKDVEAKAKEEAKKQKADAKASKEAKK